MYLLESDRRIAADDHDVSTHAELPALISRQRQEPEPQRVSAGPAPPAEWSSRLAPPAPYGRGRIASALLQLFERGGRTFGRRTQTQLPAVAAPPETTNELRQSDASQSSPDETVRLSAADSASADDRRAFPRRDSGCVVSICIHGDGEPVNAQQISWRLHSSRLKGSLIDISMNGAAIRSPEPINAGQTILMRLANRSFDTQVDTIARVVRTMTDGEGQWKSVCEFRQELTFEQIHSLGRQLFQSEFV